MDIYCLWAHDLIACYQNIVIWTRNAEFTESELSNCSANSNRIYIYQMEIKIRVVNLEDFFPYRKHNIISIFIRFYLLLY